MNVLLAIVLVIAGVAISLGIIAATGGSPVDALLALLDGSLGTRERIAITAARMSPLVLIALGWIVAFRGAKVNLGLQGQMIAGGIVSAYIALEGPSLPPALALILATLAGMLAGALFAGIAAVLWAKRGVNEIVSTLMLTFIATQVLLWIVRGPLHDLSSSAFQSRPLPSEYRWPALVDRTPFTMEIFLTVAAVVIIVFVLNRTVFGYKLRLAGENPTSARHAGVQTIRTIVVSFVLSGALAGLSGTGLVIGGERNVLSGGFAGNIGYTGIVVALVARNSPVGCVAAAALFAILDTGGSVMQVRADVPSEMIFITQGIIVVLVATSVILTRWMDARATTRRAAVEREDDAVR